MRPAAHGQHPGEADRLRGGQEPHGDHGAVLRGHHGDHGPGAGQRQADDRPQGLWSWPHGILVLFWEVLVLEVMVWFWAEVAL